MPVVTDYTALLSGSYWGGIEVRTPVIVTYSFTTAATIPDYPVEGFTAGTEATFQEFSDAEKTQARTALAEWADASSIVFVRLATVVPPSSPPLPGVEPAMVARVSGSQ